MADRKITDLTALPAGNQATGDLLTIVDVSEGAAVDKNKKITVESLFKGIPGNVGIGITTPGTHLVVQQNNIHDPNFHEDDDAAILIKNSASGSGGKSVIKLDNEAALVYGDGSSNLIFSDLSNERMRIDSSGRLLIGTTSAINSGYTGGSIQLRDNAGGVVVFKRNDGNVTNSLGILEFHSSFGRAAKIEVNNDAAHSGSSTPGAIVFSTTPSGTFNTPAERMRIDSSGRLLVGTTTSSEDCSTVFEGSSSSAAGIVHLSRSTGVSSGSVLGALSFSDNAQNDYAQIKAAADFTPSGSSYPGRLLFLTTANNETALTERMRIDSSGRVGIGETSMDGLLVIKGDSNASTQPSIRLKDGTDTREAWISNASGDLVLVNGGDDNTPHCKITLFDGNIIRFDTANTERMRLDSSGRLGIKNSSPGSQYFNDLVIGDGTSDHGITLHAGSTNASSIAFSDSTSGTGRYSGRLQYDHNSNSMRFYVNDGNEHMRLDSSGQALFYSTGNPITSGTSQGAGTTFKVFTGVHSRASTTGSGTVSIHIFSNGNIQNTNNSYGQISDVKLKENIVNANSQWDDIKGIQVRNFNFKEETGSPTHTQIGVVAQELETVSPGLVYETPDTDDEGNDLGTVTKSVNYSVLYMKAVKALQEAMDRIETLETKVAALEAQ